MQFGQINVFELSSASLSPQGYTSSNDQNSRERERERDRERERERERRSLGAPGIARSKDATGGSCERERERAWTVPELHMASSQVEFLPLVFNSYDPHTGAGVCGSLRENVTRHRLLHPSQDFRPSKGQKVFAVCFAVVHVLC